jgi:4-oxalocrotonate tautomerase
MPMIKVRYTPTDNKTGLTTEIAALLTRLTGEILKKDKSVTSVLVESAGSDAWIIAGASAAEQRTATYYVEVSVTKGTNTKDETTEYVQRVHREMSALLGTVHEASYVLVHAVDGDAYGYGGRTQNARWSAAH